VERQQRLALQHGLCRLADGDRAAFRPVFDLAWPEVQRVAARMMRTAADADDAAQTALCKLFERASEFDPARDALAWIVGIASYECLTLRKKAARRREAAGAHDALGAIPDDARDPEAQAIAAELEAVALSVLGTLDPRDPRRRIRARRRPRDVSQARRARARAAARRLEGSWHRLI